MMLSDEAILLGTRELGEADLIATYLTRTHGVVRGVARHGRRSRKRFGGTFEPLARVRLTWTERDGRDLHRLEGADLDHSYSTMQSDPVIQAACAVASDILQGLATPGERDDDRPFRLLVAVLDALEAGEAVFPVVRYFEAWILRLHGLAPDADSCGACHRALRGAAGLSADDGSLRCGECARRDPMSPHRIGASERAFLRTVAGGPPRGLEDFRAVCRPGGALEAFLRGALQNYTERPLRTYRHLASISQTHPPAPA